MERWSTWISILLAQICYQKQIIYLVLEGFSSLMLKRNIGLINNLLTLFFILINLSWANFIITPSDNTFNFVIGIIIGILIFPISLYLCNYSFKKDFFVKISKLIAKNIFTKQFLFYCLVTACIEEYIWRYSIFNGILLIYLDKESIAIVSILSFFCIHFDFNKSKKKKNGGK